MAGAVDQLYKRSSKQIILPTHKRENGDHNTSLSVIYGYGNGSCINQIVPEYYSRYKDCEQIDDVVVYA